MLHPPNAPPLPMFHPSQCSTPPNAPSLHSFPSPSPPIFPFLAPSLAPLPPSSYSSPTLPPSLPSLPTLFPLSGLAPLVRLVRFDLTTLLDHCCLKCVSVPPGFAGSSSVSQHVKQPHPLQGNMKWSLPLLQLLPLKHVCTEPDLTEILVKMI